MLNRLRQLREEHGNRDNGFTLIELLVVVVIVGILLAIAIPLYLHFENGAKNNSAEADVHNAIAVVNQCTNESAGSLPASANDTGNAGGDVTLDCPDATTTEVIHVSSGNTLVYTQGTGGNYTITAVNGDTSTGYKYDSSTGQTTSYSG